MRGMIVVLAALTVAGCGAQGDEEAAFTGSTTVTEASAPDSAPPPIVLESPYGDQTAVRGSYSVSYETGVLNADGPAARPKEVTAVVAGDEVRFVFAGAEIVSAGGCHGGDPQDCIGSVGVKPLGCDNRSVETIPLELGPETTWTVDLEPGAYELAVFASYESEGANGHVSGSLGLTVAGAKHWDALGVYEVERSMRVCSSD